MAEERVKEKVTVVSRREITTYPKLRTPAVQVVVMYSTADLPPSSLFIPKEEWSEEKERELIKEDIKKRREEKPETFEI